MPVIRVRERYLLSSGGAVTVAAAYSARGDVRKALALAVFRAASKTGTCSSIKDLSREMAQVLRKQLVRKATGGYLSAPGRAPALIELQDMAARVMVWMAAPACPHCKGRGHHTVPNTPVLDVRRRCNRCKGTGKEPIERVVRSEHTEIARAMIDGLAGTTNHVFSDMAKMMNGEMSVFRKDL